MLILFVPNGIYLRVSECPQRDRAPANVEKQTGQRVCVGIRKNQKRSSWLPGPMYHTRTHIHAWFQPNNHIRCVCTFTCIYVHRSPIYRSLKVWGAHGHHWSHRPGDGNQSLHGNPSLGQSPVSHGLKIQLVISPLRHTDSLVGHPTRIFICVAFIPGLFTTWHCEHMIQQSSDYACAACTEISAVFACPNWCCGAWILEASWHFLWLFMAVYNPIRIAHEYIDNQSACVPSQALPPSYFYSLPNNLRHGGAVEVSGVVVAGLCYVI